MNIGVLHPIAHYIFWFICIISVPLFILDVTFGWNLRSKRFQNEEIILSIGYFILFFGYLLFSSFSLAFFAFAGLVVNYDFWWTLIVCAIFGWWLFGYVDNFSEIFNTSFKRIFTILLSIFVLFFLFFFIFFYEDRIYKVSKYCKPTENPKIKICKFSNGFYKGELKAFKRHGEGIYKFNSGASYLGGWKNNLRHGTGVTTTAEGEVTTDVWKKGKKLD